MVRFSQVKDLLARKASLKPPSHASHLKKRSDRQFFSDGAKQDAKEDDAGDHAEHDNDDLRDGLRRNVAIANGQHCDQHEVCSCQPPAQQVSARISVKQLRRSVLLFDTT